MVLGIIKTRSSSVCHILYVAENINGDELNEGDDLGPVWTKLCQIKHYNPLLGPNFHVKVEHEKIKFHPGPHFEDNIWKEFILMHSSSLVIDALKDIYQSFIKYHVSPQKWEEQFNALELEAQEFLRKNTG